MQDHTQVRWVLRCADITCAAIHYNMLQHTAPHRNTPQHTQRYTVLMSLMLLYTTIRCFYPHPSDLCLQHTAPHCNTLHHTATHYNTLQHTATHCNALQLQYADPTPIPVTCHIRGRDECKTIHKSTWQAELVSATRCNTL